jgi:hypothetical protein
MRVLIMLEQTETGFAVQAPDSNPEFRDLLFAYVDVAEPQERIAA